MFTVAVHNVQYHITLCFFHTRAFINCQTGQGQCYPNPLKAYQQIPCQLKLSPKEAGRYHCHPLGPTFAQ